MPIFGPETTLGSIAFDKAGTLVGTRSALNVIEGSNIGLTVADNAGQNRVDLTLSAVTSSYQATLIALGPASYWPLDETSGTTASDVESLVNGTYVGSPTLAQAPLISSGGTSVSIGAAEGIDLGSAAYRFDGTSSFSWLGWVNVSAKVNTNHYLIGHAWSNASGAQGWNMSAFFGANATYIFSQSRYLNGAQLSCDSTAACNVGDRHFFVFSYDGASMRTYVDGALAATTADSRTLVASTGVKVVLGNEATIGAGTLYLNGLLDEVAVFTRALSLSEISSLYSAGL